MDNFEFIPGTSPENLNDNYFIQVESNLGIKFPREYYEFLKFCNGGIPLKKYFYFKNNEKVIERFLSLVSDYKANKYGMYDVEVVWSQIEDRLDDFIIPFAALFAGDFLCIDLRNSSSFKIVLWDHELSTEEESVIFPVADSFDALLSMLHEHTMS